MEAEEKIRPMMSLKQTAKALGLDVRKVRRIVEEKKINAVQLTKGGNYRIPADEADRVREALKTTPSNPLKRVLRLVASFFGISYSKLPA
ncbi:MAG: helix-turn-helix domain-containing protein [Candidatus Levybacteria bacterium]|nr:helix-turn-helix domain-containing protein [Candidatus Levybacteria bacterium]